MTEHASGYSVAAALELARTLKYGPLPGPEDPVPSHEEAIGLIRTERRTCGFNWLTGEGAEAVLRAYVEGSGSQDPQSPYPDWSDEHRAWQESQTNGRGG